MLVIIWIHWCCNNRKLRNRGRKIIRGRLNVEVDGRRIRGLGR